MLRDIIEDCLWRIKSWKWTKDPSIDSNLWRKVDHTNDEVDIVAALINSNGRWKEELVT